MTLATRIALVLALSMTALAWRYKVETERLNWEADLARARRVELSKEIDECEAKLAPSQRRWQR